MDIIHEERLEAGVISIYEGKGGIIELRVENSMGSASILIKKEELKQVREFLIEHLQD